MASRQPTRISPIETAIAAVNGSPRSVASTADHYNAASMTKTYVHASDDDLKQGRQALAKIHKIV